MDFRNTPQEYGAIHFHDDDLEDAGWQVDFRWTLPPACQSGVYAARLRTEGGEDHIPFFIRPPKGRTSAAIAFLAPTNSYLAYANEQLTDLPPALFPNQKQGELSPEDRYTRENRLLSLYDSHADGSGGVLFQPATAHPQYAPTLPHAGAQLSAPVSRRPAPDRLARSQGPRP